MVVSFPALEREPGNETGSDVAPFPGSWALSAHIRKPWNEARYGEVERTLTFGQFLQVFDSSMTHSALVTLVQWGRLERESV